MTVTVRREEVRLGRLSVADADKEIVELSETERFGTLAARAELPLCHPRARKEERHAEVSFLFLSHLPRESVGAWGPSLGSGFFSLSPSWA